MPVISTSEQGSVKSSALRSSAIMSMFQWSLWNTMPANNAFERSVGSHALAAAAQGGR